MKIRNAEDVEVAFNGDFDLPNMIKTFFHCAQCLQELPVGESPMTWARINVGVLETGDIQIWCTRHNINIVLLTLQAIQVKH